MAHQPTDPIGRFILRRNYRKALELLARAHARDLGRLCFAITGDQSEAEELTQEILLAAYHSMASYEGRSALRTWLYTIARRICFRSMKRKQHRRSILAAGETELRPTEPDDPLRQLEASDEQHRLWAAVDQLPSTQQEVVLLRYVSGLSFREVGGVCGITEEAARQRASSALRRLRRALARPAAEVSGLDPQLRLACQELSR